MLSTEVVGVVAHRLGTVLTELGQDVHTEIANAVPELRGDPLILELLRASTESNVETFLHVAQHAIGLADVTAPPAAVEYGRRLAQRGISSNALLRAYRIGQRMVLALALDEIARQSPDRDVALEAARTFQTLSFDYVDKVAEIVIAEYEAERERWLSHRNTVRAAALTKLLGGAPTDVARAEAALGYRLRQAHLGVVIWAEQPSAHTDDLHALETAVTRIKDAVGGVGQPFFVPRERSLAWAWIPLGGSGEDVDLAAIPAALRGSGMRVALGSVGRGATGFRLSHEGAARAQAVALFQAPGSGPVISFDEPGVRAAGLLAADLASAKDLVATTLGGLAADDVATARLRETLRAFLAQRRSFLSTAELLHVHKNTVKYRVDRAIELRGRPIDEDRLNLELALVACHWLGSAVLAE